MKSYTILLFCIISFQLNAQQDVLFKNKTLIQKELKDWIATFKNFNLSDFKFNDSFTSKLTKDTNDLLMTAVTKDDATALLSIKNRSKTYALDLYSGQATLQYKKGKYSFEDADDGGPLYLHSLKKRKTYKVEYNSFSYYADEAFWLTDSTFIIAFISTADDNKKPTIFLGNITKDLLYCFNNVNQKCFAKLGSYTSKKLLQLNKRK